ncbi:A/G-specific adenine glycosylase [Pseudolysinimonas sp.]|uniref:A/G-specific adenine glycosylase n=1 Tax=Pseudolysinimonas sp. TaxID=2680009 RepID=UPI003F81E1AD
MHERSAEIGPLAIGERIADWYEAGHRDLPWRRDGFGAWGILVSEFMLQQTPVARVVPKLEAWLARWPTAAALAAEPSGEAVRAWDRLGYPRRALALHGAAVAITAEHGGVVPADVDALLALPGVGPYTARAVAAFAYGVRVPVVDVNTRRVLARSVLGQGDAGPANARRDHELMEAILPTLPARARQVNAGAMELGQTVCVARSPRCDVCPLRTACAWLVAGSPSYDGPTAPRQKRYEGSDRQARGRILRELRGSEIPVPADAVAALWPDVEQRERALAGLLRDGLVVGDPSTGYTLPE